MLLARQRSPQASALPHATNPACPPGAGARGHHRADGQHERRVCDVHALCARRFRILPHAHAGAPGCEGWARVWARAHRGQGSAHLSRMRTYPSPLPRPVHWRRRRPPSRAPTPSSPTAFPSPRWRCKSGGPTCWRAVVPPPARGCQLPHPRSRLEACPPAHQSFPAVPSRPCTLSPQAVLIASRCMPHSLLLALPRHHEPRPRPIHHHQRSNSCHVFRCL